MKALKFDEHDRSKVIAEVEAHFSVKLSRVGKFRKFLQDQSGKSYWVLGGYDDWHGITADMLKEQKRRSGGGLLVVAKRRPKSIEIFAGDLQTLIANERELSHTQTGDHQFNVTIRGSSMTIKEIPDLTLRKIGPTHEFEIPIGTILAKLSPAEKKRLFQKLNNKREV